MNAPFAIAHQSTVSDLPAGSFSESGTNVPTGILKIRKVAA